MLNFETASKPRDQDLSGQPPLWPAALIAAGIVASILWVGFISWCVVSALWTLP